MSASEKVTFSAPLKGVRIIPENPPPPPPPTFSEEELAQRAAQARQQGVDETTQNFNNQLQQQRAQTVTLQQGLFQNIEKRFEGMTQEVNNRLPALILALVRRVLCDVRIDGETVSKIVLEALAEISSETEVMEVSLNPGDLEMLKRFDAQLESRYPKLTFRADPAMHGGDCKITSRFGIVDATIEKKLKKVEEDLSGEA